MLFSLNRNDNSLFQFKKIFRTTKKLSLICGFSQALHCDKLPLSSVPSRSPDKGSEVIVQAPNKNVTFSLQAFNKFLNFPFAVLRWHTQQTISSAKWISFISAGDWWGIPRHCSRSDKTYVEQKLWATVNHSCYKTLRTAATFGL